MLCSKCGVEISDEDKTCPKCGNSENSTSSDTSDGMERKRHVFTSFWLIFSLIVAIAMVIAAFVISAGSSAMLLIFAIMPQSTQNSLFDRSNIVVSLSLFATGTTNSIIYDNEAENAKSC